MINIYDSITHPPKSLLPADIRPMVSVITKRDIEAGEITRYFCRPVNRDETSEIMEVDKQIYQQLKSNNMYTTVDVRWIIRGRIADVAGLTNINTPTRLYTGVETSNRLSVAVANEQMPGLKNVITNYLKFWQGE